MSRFDEALLYTIPFTNLPTRTAYVEEATEQAVFGPTIEEVTKSVWNRVEDLSDITYYMTSLAEGFVEDRFSRHAH